MFETKTVAEMKLQSTTQQLEKIPGAAKSDPVAIKLDKLAFDAEDKYALLVAVTSAVVGLEVKRICVEGPGVVAYTRLQEEWHDVSAQVVGDSLQVIVTSFAGGDGAERAEDVARIVTNRLRAYEAG